MEPWQLDLLRQVEASAYQPTVTDPAWLLGAIGDAVHHVVGHTEADWHYHLETCPRPCGRLWATGGRKESD